MIVVTLQADRTITLNSVLSKYVEGVKSISTLIAHLGLKRIPTQSIQLMHSMLCFPFAVRHQSSNSQAMMSLCDLGKPRVTCIMSLTHEAFHPELYLFHFKI